MADKDQTEQPEQTKPQQQEQKQKKSRARSKATSGAWWKSVDVDKEQAEGEEQKTEAETSPAGAAAQKTAQKTQAATPRKRVRKSAGQPASATTAQPGEKGEEAKKARTSSAKKKTQKLDQAPAPEAAGEQGEKIQVSAPKKAVQDTGEQAPGTTVQDPAEGAQAPEPKKKTARPRKAQQKKPAMATAPASLAETGSDSAMTAQTGPEPSAEPTEENQKTSATAITPAQEDILIPTASAEQGANQKTSDIAATQSQEENLIDSRSAERETRQKNFLAPIEQLQQEVFSPTPSADQKKTPKRSAQSPARAKQSRRQETDPVTMKAMRAAIQAIALKIDPLLAHIFPEGVEPALYQSNPEADLNGQPGSSEKDPAIMEAVRNAVDAIALKLDPALADVFRDSMEPALSGATDSDSVPSKRSGKKEPDPATMEAVRVAMEAIALEIDPVLTEVLRESPDPAEKPQDETMPPVIEHASRTEGEPRDDEPASQRRKRSRRSGRKKEAPATHSAEEAEDEFHDTVPDVPEEEIAAKGKSYKLLINAEEPEECRIALLEDGRLESFHVTTLSREATKNNIYKGRIVSIEANLQAAFLDIGTGRNGFLPFNEIHPEYFRQDLSEKNQQFVNQQQWKKLKIEEVMQKGQEVLVQVVKEVTGNKGANMTTYLSLPGRCLVLMPGSDSAGISRKITGEERRASLREIMAEFEIPEGIGYIIRTASAEITREALEKDLHNLLTLWEEIKERGQTLPSPALVYEEQDMITRFLRDHFFSEINEIQVDTEESLQNVQTFVDELPKEQRQVKLRLHRGSKPIFNQYNVEEQIESIFRPRVELPSGGSIVIDPTEALVAIDVNSGRTSKNSDFEETIFLANMEAAAELSRQLRLRDLGGLIVVDFIDMRNKKHIRDVERQVKVSMKRDKAKVDISRISRFGLMQISRQKMGAPIEKGSYRTCEHCQGRGTVRSVETLSLYYLRRIQTGVTRKKVSRVECRLPLEVAQYLLNKKRDELSELEHKHHARIEIIPQVAMHPADSQIEFLAGEKES